MKLLIRASSARCTCLAECTCCNRPNQGANHRNDIADHIASHSGPQVEMESPHAHMEQSFETIEIEIKNDKKQQSNAQKYAQETAF